MLDINLKGSRLVARRVIPVMIAQRSGLTNSSLPGLHGMRRLSHYAASKWGSRPRQLVGDRAWPRTGF